MELRGIGRKRDEKTLENYLLTRQLELLSVLENSCINNENKEVALAELENIKNQLNAIFQNKITGQMIRCKEQQIEEGEKCTKLFLNLEKSRSKER